MTETNWANIEIDKLLLEENILNEKPGQLNNISSIELKTLSIMTNSSILADRNPTLFVITERGFNFLKIALIFALVFKI